MSRAQLSQKASTEWVVRIVLQLQLVTRVFTGSTFVVATKAKPGRLKQMLTHRINISQSGRRPRTRDHGVRHPLSHPNSVQAIEIFLPQPPLTQNHTWRESPSTQSFVVHGTINCGIHVLLHLTRAGVRARSACPLQTSSSGFKCWPHCTLLGNLGGGTWWTMRT